MLKSSKRVGRSLRRRPPQRSALPKSVLKRSKRWSNCKLQRQREEGKLFGSVGTRDIADALTAAGCDADKAEVRLPDGAIRELGEYEIMIQLHADVVTTANIAVVAE